MGQTVVEMNDLTKIFGEKLIAVNNVSFAVERGAIFGFLGPNGAGKTTTIRLLLGLIRPTAGEVRVFGERMTPGSSDLRRRMGYLPTNPRFPPKMTPITYLDFVGKLFGLGVEERMGRLSALIRSVGLLGDSSREIAGFSTGMVTRLGLAAALMNDPELLILDEPTSGLDPSGRRETLELITELGKEKTIIVSSHILSDIDRICTDVGVISQGKAIFSGSIKDMKKSTRSHVVRLELEGGVEKLCVALKAEKWVVSFETRGDFAVDVAFDPETPVAEAVKGVTELVSRLELDLISISSSTSSIEDAFMGLLRDEESRRFLTAA
ncbi:MAG TPA: ABC transporter ATP-binding protein [Nitrososphaerales archaeon]|nr:ABC transporter ATP-binding protein [Nitrososphaerales archaeon]